MKALEAIRTTNTAPRGFEAAPALMLALTLSLLTACGKPLVPPKATCQPPRLEAAPSGPSDQVARVAAFNCVKNAAFQGVQGGGPVAAAAAGALSRCADEEARYVAAVVATRPVGAWEQSVIHDQLTQLAHMTAAQKRSRGCGRPGGAPEKLLDTPSP